MWVKLGRDRETGKSKGFAFLKYEDQRSTDLAVDNLSGADVLGRKLNVDHKVYPPGEVPEEEDEEGMRLMAELDAHEEADQQQDGADGQDEPKRPLLPEERELQELMRTDDDDPMKESMIEQKQGEVRKAIKRWEKENRKQKHHHRHRHHHRQARLENGHRGHDRSPARSQSSSSDRQQGREAIHRHREKRERSQNSEDRRYSRVQHDQHRNLGSGDMDDHDYARRRRKE